MTNREKAVEWWESLTEIQKIDAKWLYCGSIFNHNDLANSQIELIYNFMKNDK